MASIRKRSDKWQARIIRKGFQPISQTFVNRSDAEKWARAVEREIDLGIYAVQTESASMLLGDLVKRYREEVSPTKRGGEMEAIRLRALENRSISKLGLKNLSSKSIARYRDDRLKQVLPITVNRDLDDLSAVLNHARKEWGIQVTNLVNQIRRPPKGKGRDRVLGLDEEKKLVAVMQGGRNEQGRYIAGTRNPWVKPIVELALETAMRRGELLSLEWQHIDIDKRTAFLPMTKNGEVRTVPLSSRAILILKALPGTQSGRVFPLTPMALRKAFERACESAGIDNLHFHDLRHTATTRMASKLPNLIELAAVTGHKDVRMLARYYHPKAEDLALKLG